jgi:hypothetical protein
LGGGRIAVSPDAVVAADSVLLPLAALEESLRSPFLARVYLN